MFSPVMMVTIIATLHADGNTPLKEKKFYTLKAFAAAAAFQIF